MRIIGKGPRLLLCEGDNDCHVVFAIRDHYGVVPNFELDACGSDELVIKKAAALVEAEAQEVIGIILDADNPSRISKWQSLRDRLKRVGLELPDAPQAGGTILDRTSVHPRVGVWIMPDNLTDGMLEDFCAAMAPTEALNFAGQCADRAKELGHASFIDPHRTKAQIHTYLAWQDEPGRPLGISIKARSFNPEHDLTRSFADWLAELFKDGPAITPAPIIDPEAHGSR